MSWRSFTVCVVRYDLTRQKRHCSTNRTIITSYLFLIHTARSRRHCSFYRTTSSQKWRRYSLCVLASINVTFTSADGADSVCCFLFVHKMMGNGEKVCTSEGCRLGKARLRTNYMWLMGIGRRRPTVSDSPNSLSDQLVFILRALLLTNKTTWSFITLFCCHLVLIPRISPFLS